MGEEGKKNAGKDGVVIKKNSASAGGKKDENREELPIDSLDGGSRGASETSVKKRTDIHTEDGTETGLKNEDVERLNEDEITGLLSAKNDLEESKRLIEEKTGSFPSMKTSSNENRLSLKIFEKGRSET